MKVESVGSSCGKHGTYIFYKAFSFNVGPDSTERVRIISLGEFFFVKLWHDQDTLCVGELQLVFTDNQSESLMVSVRLYFLPENTPEGRSQGHGQDEILAVQEKLTMRADDLASVVYHAGCESVTTTVNDSLTNTRKKIHWHTGFNAGAAYFSHLPRANFCSAFVNSRLDLRDVEFIKNALNNHIAPDEACVVVLSYDQYCRLRALIKRLENVNSHVYSHHVVKSLGGFAIPSKNTRLLFCRDVFDHPELDSMDIVCNHMAPKLRGRSRKEARRAGSPINSESGSERDDSVIDKETDDGGSGKRARSSALLKYTAMKPQSPVMSQSTTSMTNGVHSRVRPAISASCATPPGLPVSKLRSSYWAEPELLTQLHHFMCRRGTPITRLPMWSGKKLNVCSLYRSVQKLGGYTAVSECRLWRTVHDILGGDKEPALAAAATRRCYERICLPFERYDRQISLGSSKVVSRNCASSSGKAGGNSVSPSENITVQPRSPISASTLNILARTRPSITITPLPSGSSVSDNLSPSGYAALQRITNVAHKQHLASQLAAASPRVGSSSVNMAAPTRIGSITITPVAKSTASQSDCRVGVESDVLASSTASARSGLDQLLALHMTSPHLTPSSDSAVVTPEQLRANVDAYKMLVARGLYKAL